MPDNAQQGLISVAADELTTVNGVAQVEPLPKAQRVKPGYGTDGEIQDVDPAHPLPTTDDGLGADGDTPPALATNARGVRGWLRGIYDKLSGTLTVHVDNEAAAVDVTGLAQDATLSGAVGGPGSSEPALTNGGSGLLGYLRTILDALRGPLSTTPTGAGDVAGTLTDGRKTVTTPGTAVAVRASLTCKWVQVVALKTNTQQVNVGGSDVLATSGSSTGTPLDPGQSTTIPVNDAAKVFIDARVGGEGVSFTVGA